MRNYFNKDGIQYTVEGNYEKAFHVAVVQMAMLRMTNVFKLPQVQSERVLDDGTVIRCSIMHGVRQTLILASTPGVGGKEEEKKEKGQIETTEKKYYPALQVYASENEPPTTPPPYGAPSWLVPTKLGLIVSMTEGSFNGPYKFIALEAEDYKVIHGIGYQRDKMDWKNGTIPPFWYEYSRYYGLDVPADVHDFEDRIQVEDDDDGTFYVLYQPQVGWAYISKELEYVSTGGGWEGGGSLADDAYPQDKNVHGEVWNEAIWWEDEKKMLFRVMRTYVSRGIVQWNTIAKKSGETILDKSVFDLSYLYGTTGRIDYSFKYVYYTAPGAVGHRNYYTAYYELQTDADINDDAYTKMSATNPGGPNTIKWHCDTLNNSDGDRVEFSSVLTPDNADNFSIYCVFLGTYYQPPASNTNYVKGPYEEENKDLYWDEKPSYPSSLIHYSDDPGIYPAHNYIYMNGLSLELETYMPEDWANKGMLWYLGPQMARCYQTEKGSIALSLINDYPSYYSPPYEHYLNYVCVIEGSSELQAVHGPLFTHEDPGVQGIDYYGPETYFDLTRHRISNKMLAVLPQSHQDCIWSVGEFRLLEVEITTEIESDEVTTKSTSP